MNGNSGGRQFDDWAKVASWKGTGATTFLKIVLGKRSE